MGGIVLVQDIRIKVTANLCQAKDFGRRGSHDRPFLKAQGSSRAETRIIGVQAL